jgi:hypothetical protein
MTQHAIAPPHYDSGPYEPAPHRHHYAAPAPPPPLPTGGQAPPRRRGGGLLPAAALVVALAAGVLSGITLARQAQLPQPATLPAPSGAAPSAPAAPLPSPVDVAAAEKIACDAWSAAAPAMVSARKPFLAAPPDWQNPITVNALVQAQTGILGQVEYLRQHISPATPADVAGPIADYIMANIDIIAIDGQYQSAAVANAAAERGASAASRVRTACGIS